MPDCYLHENRLVKLTLPILLTLIFSSSFGQSNEIIFKTELKPDRIYSSTILTSIKSEINFSGAKEKIEQIKSKGVKLPMIVEGSNEIVTITTTGVNSDNNSFPVTIVYESMKSKNVINGNVTEKENPITGLIVEGFYSPETKLKIDTIISSNIDDNIRYVLKSTIESTQQLVSFPTGPMKIGDIFEQSLPMTIPIAGMKPAKIVINMTYKLTDISEKNATFDILQTVQLDMSIEQTNLEASGSGTGIIIYDIRNNYITKNDTDLLIDMVMNMDGLMLRAKMKSITSQSVEIEMPTVNKR